MHWSQSRFWKSIALLAVVGIFTLAYSIYASVSIRRGGAPIPDFPVVQAAPAEDMLVIPESTTPRLQVMTTADTGNTLVWWYFKIDAPGQITLTDKKEFRRR